MKYNLLLIVFTAIISCNNKPKDSIHKADSANKANLDSGLKHNTVVIDQASTDFLVRFYDFVTTEMELSSITMHNGVSPSVKEFAATLYHELQTMNDSIQSIRMEKNIVLPSMLSAQNQSEIEELKILLGAKLDQKYLSSVVKRHEDAEPFLKKAMQDSKDEQVRSFADISLIIFKKYLNDAKSVH